MATYRDIGVGGGTTGTGNRSATYTPAVGDLLVVFALVSANTNAAPTMSDDQSGAYDLITTALHNVSGDMISAFVRTAFAAAATAHVITAATGSNNSGELFVNALSGMKVVGRSAVRQSTVLQNQLAGIASFTFPLPCNKANLTIGFTGDENPGFAQPVPGPDGWTNQGIAGQLTPTKGGNVVSRDSGFEGTVVTYLTADLTAFGGIFLEMEAGLLVGSYNRDIRPATRRVLAAEMRVLPPTRRVQAPERAPMPPSRRVG